MSISNFLTSFQTYLLISIVLIMCYNCGCEVPDDDMGKGKISEGGASLTEDDFKILAEKWGMSLKEAKENVLNLLKKQLAK